MLYHAIKALTERLKAAEIVAAEKIYTGDQFDVNAENEQFFVIKSGQGIIENVTHKSLLHLVFWIHASKNLEAQIHNTMATVIGFTKNLPTIKPVAWTSDNDIWAPFGVENIRVIPPFGGFRIDFEVFESVPPPLVELEL